MHAACAAACGSCGKAVGEIKGVEDELITRGDWRRSSGERTKLRAHMVAFVSTATSDELEEVERMVGYRRAALEKDDEEQEELHTEL